MLNMDNNPVPASQLEVRVSAIRQAAMSRLAPGVASANAPERLSRMSGPIWRRALVRRSSWPRSGSESRSCSWSRRSWSAAGT